MSTPRRRKPWILWVGLPALVAFGAWEVWDQRPLLAQEEPPRPVAGREPFALVELFTSEG